MSMKRVEVAGEYTWAHDQSTDWKQPRATQLSQIMQAVNGYSSCSEGARCLHHSAGNEIIVASKSYNPRMCID